MKSKDLLRGIVYLLGGAIGIVLIGVIFLALVKMPIDLTGQKGLIESAAGHFLDRTVSVDGNLEVTTSLWPVFQMDGLRIGNPKDFPQGDFASMKHAEIQISVIPLLLGKVHIDDFSVEKILVTLRENKDGAVNWSSQRQIPSDKSAPEARPQETASTTDKVPLTSDDFVLQSLTFRDISVSFQGSSMAEPAVFRIDEAAGSGRAGEPFTLSLKGSLLNEQFTTTVEAGSIQELLEESRSWMKIHTEIAESQFAFEGDVDLARTHLSFRIKALVQSERLDSLNHLLHLDLPPLKSCRVGMILSWQDDRLELEDLEVQVGKSKLLGKGTIDTAASVPSANLEFNSPLIQLDDFDLGDWSPETGKTAKAEKADAGENYADVFSPDTLSRFDFNLKVSADRVMSGSDELGSGTLTAALNKGRFSLDPVKLVLPGGSLYYAMSVKPGKVASEASVRAIVDNFDFGILARRAKPGTDMGGTLSLDVDLKSKARNLGELMANAKGHFDFSGHPVNLHAGIVDLWAVNLIAAIASKGDDKGSTINCVVGRWSMKDGILQPDAFVIDTTAIRICGTGQADFKQQVVDLTAAPTAKKPEYFSLATPIEIHGNFDDFELGISPGEILATTAKFVTSPVHTTIRRLLGDELPEIGDDVCGMNIGAKNRPTQLPLGCGSFQITGE